MPPIYDGASRRLLDREWAVPAQRAAPASRAVADPAGYLVVYVDAGRRLLVIEHPRPFTWTKTAEEILDSLARYIARISGAGH